MKIWKTIAAGAAGLVVGALAEYGTSKLLNKRWPDDEFDDDHELNVGDGLDGKIFPHLEDPDGD